MFRTRTFIAGATAALVAVALTVTGIAAAQASSPGGKPMIKPGMSYSTDARTKAPTTQGLHGIAASASSDDYTQPFVMDPWPAVNGAIYNIGATTQAYEPRTLALNSRYEIYNTIWITWKAPSNGIIEADTLESHFDTTMAVFTGSSMKTAKRLAVNDDASPGVVQSQIRSLAVTKGTTYHFQVGTSYLPGASQDVVDSVSGAVSFHLGGRFTAPSNDMQTHATSESGSSWTATGSTVGATIEESEPTSNPTNSTTPRLGSVWWKWTAAAQGTATVAFSTKTPSYQRDDAYIAVFRQAIGGSFEQVAFNQGASDTFTIPVYAGSTYFFQVGEVDNFEAGTDTIHLTAAYTGPQITKLSSTHGSHNGGSTVTITGTHLSGTTAVYFGPANSVTEFVSASSTKIVLKTPSAAKGTAAVYLLAGGVFSAVSSKLEYTFS